MLFIICKNFLRKLFGALFELRRRRLRLSGWFWASSSSSSSSAPADPLRLVDFPLDLALALALALAFGTGGADPADLDDFKIVLRANKWRFLYISKWPISAWHF